MTPLPTLRDVLSFYAEAGVDAALADAPINRFAAPESKAVPARADDGTGTRPGRPAAPPPTAVIVNRASVPDDTQIARARALAGQAATLDELRAAMDGFDGCNLKFTAKQMVFADGNPQAGLMFVGEAPGRDEDIEGLPFVGRSGKLLDRMLTAIGLDRSKAYIANVIPWRPPGNRTPTPLETEICRPFIERQIELANPKVLVTLGGPAAKVVLGATEGIMRLRGHWGTHTTASGKAIPVMPTLHPAYLLRNPAHKKLAWRDFLAVKGKLAALR